MNTTSSHTEQREELARRTGDGLDVRLLWSPRTNRLTVAVRDVRLGDSFELQFASSADALDAYEHPFAYAAWSGIDYALPAAA